MKAEDIQFLKDLQIELNTQDKVSQADPRFWVIMDYKWTIIPDDYAETYRIYDCDGSWDLEEFLDYVENDLVPDDDDYTFLQEILDSEDDNYDKAENIVNSLNKYLETDEYSLLGVERTNFIVSDTMFLTIREAKEHLKSNYYHYTSKAHPYAMTAWRSPQVEQLIGILQQADFGLITVDIEEGYK